jgi:heat shock protein HtpX
MFVALALNALLLAGLIALAVYAVSEGQWVLVLLFASAAVAGAVTERRRGKRSHKAVDMRYAERAVARLSAMADIPVPVVRSEPDAAPLSWTTAAPRRKPQIHVTRGLVRTVEGAELEAVLAHELSHIANRDAVVMTILAAPGVYVLRGMRRAWEHKDWRTKPATIIFSLLLVPPALASAGLALIVSRHRELAADRGAALLTGSPAAMAAALTQLSGGVSAIPKEDLRAVAARDLLHVVPVRAERGIARLWATHPRLDTRIHELERLERDLQARG